MEYLVDQNILLWLPIPNNANYFISSNGIVRNVVTGIFLQNYLSQSASKFYYLHCSLGRIHRLLGAAMIGRNLKRLEYVRHINGDGFDNRLENLEISSPKRNSEDKILHGTNGRKLSNSQVRTIRGLSKSKSATMLADQFGISISHIYGILDGSRWGNLPC